ncbi:MAG: cysteine desulfurase family protein [Planctomycetota bacterium]
MNSIYLDHNATTPIHPEVVDAMLPFLREGFGNPSSLHEYGQVARRAVDRAREQVAGLIHAEPNEIVFVSGGTEADNHALRGVIKETGHIITSAIEHHAVLNTCQYLERMGFAVTYLPVDEEGRIDVEQSVAAFRDDTLLVSVMLANNEVGSIQPVKEIAAAARNRDILMHTDAIQAVGKMPVNVKELGVDLLSISSHKLYGPKGIGALYIRQGTDVSSLIVGGNHERKRRGGTENVPAIVGFGKACEIAEKECAIIAAHTSSLRDHLQQQILKRIHGTRVNGPLENRLPNTLNISFDDFDGEILLMSLDLEGIAVSTGSACASGSSEPSHVLRAMGKNPEQTRGSLRFSLGRDNTQAEIDAAIKTLEEVTIHLMDAYPPTDK